jgi:hypothetical protein
MSPENVEIVDMLGPEKVEEKFRLKSLLIYNHHLSRERSWRILR